MLTEGSTTEVNTVELSSDGLGVDVAEEILFCGLEELKSRINNPDFGEDYNNGIISFSEFRNTVLFATKEKYKIQNAFGMCSNEYSQVYRAFQAVGLFAENLNPPPLGCNVLSYGEGYNYADTCPPVQEYSCIPVADGLVQYNMTFPSGMSESRKYYIQVLYDAVGDGSFTHEHGFSMDGQPLTTGNLSNYEMPPFMIPGFDTPVRLKIYDVTNVGFMPSDDADTPFEIYNFSCGDICNLLGSTDGSNTDNDIPPSNQGSVSTTLSSTTFYTCPMSEICFDYTSTGPAQTFAYIDGQEFAQLITSISGTSQSGTFCWTPGNDETGTHNFQITATDGHPTQPLTQLTPVSVYVVDYTSEVYSTASPIVYKTNESSAGANDGSLTINLGSTTYTLEYHWIGQASNGDDLVTYSNWPNGNKLANLSDGTYEVDVYIQGTVCLYGTYTATVGTNSSGGGSTCQFDPGLIHMRAIPAIFNDQTTIEIELEEKPLQMSLSAFTAQGNPVQNLVSGEVLGVGTHQVTFDGSADPNGLYIFSLAIAVPQCRSGEQETINIKGFKY